MNTIREQVTNYIVALNQAKSTTEHNIAYQALMRYHYFLPETDQTDVNDLMQPYLDTLAEIQLPPDPIIQRSEEILSRIKSRVPQP